MSILERARADGFRQGVGQASQVAYDEAYWQGQQDAHDGAPSRLRWFLFGFCIGLAIMSWLAL